MMRPTLRLGLAVAMAGMFVLGCAEKPGKKKEDEKKADSKEEDKDLQPKD
jgi:outer membrane lipoprotein-sorting protein